MLRLHPESSSLHREDVPDATMDIRCSQKNVYKKPVNHASHTHAMFSRIFTNKKITPFICNGFLNADLSRDHFFVFQTVFFHLEERKFERDRFGRAPESIAVVLTEVAAPYNITSQRTL